MAFEQKPVNHKFLSKRLEFASSVVHPQLEVSPAFRATEAAANPPRNPRIPLSMLELPKIRLLVLAPLVLLFLVPPRFLHGLNTWLAKYWVPAPRAAPQAAESIAWLPVKNLVFGEFWFWLLPWGRSRVKLGLPWGAVEARTRREARTAREICIFFSAVRQGWSLYGWSATAPH